MSADVGEHRGQTIFIVAAVATIFGAIATIAVVPEVRRFLGLEEKVSLEQLKNDTTDEQPKNDTTDQATQRRAETNSSSAACVSNTASFTVHFEYSMDGSTWSPMRLRSGYDGCIGDGQPVQIRVVTAGRENLPISYLLKPGQRYQFVWDPSNQVWDVEGMAAQWRKTQKARPPEGEVREPRSRTEPSTGGQPSAVPQEPPAAPLVPGAPPAVGAAPPPVVVVAPAPVIIGQTQKYSNSWGWWWFVDPNGGFSCPQVSNPTKWTAGTTVPVQRPDGARYDVWAPACYR